MFNKHFYVCKTHEMCIFSFSLTRVLIQLLRRNVRIAIDLHIAIQAEKRLI